MRSNRSTFFGVIGAVLAFVGSLLVFELGVFGNADPIMSGILAVFILGPVSALVGFLIGRRLGD